MAADEWYLVERGQQVGPMDRAALVARLRRPGHGPDTLVWTAAMTDWAAAGTTDLARDLAGGAAPPPPPGGRTPFPAAAPAGAVQAEPWTVEDTPDRWVAFDEAFRRFWQRYVRVDGRASRSEYWWAMLAIVLISLGLSIVEVMVIGNDGGLFSGLFSLATLVPSITVGVRRLHDTDRSGWWLLFSFVPLIGIVWLLVLFCMPSTPGANRFGP